MRRNKIELDVKEQLCGSAMLIERHDFALTITNG